MPTVEEGIPSGFFDASLMGPARVILLCGAEAILYLSKTHHFTIRYVPGMGSNNKAKLAALWALLFHTDTLQLCKLQVFGDSQIVMDHGMDKWEVFLSG